MIDQSPYLARPGNTIISSFVAATDLDASRTFGILAQQHNLSQKDFWGILSFVLQHGPWRNQFVLQIKELVEELKAMLATLAVMIEKLRLLQHQMKQLQLLAQAQLEAEAQKNKALADAQFFESLQRKPKAIASLS